MSFNGKRQSVLSDAIYFSLLSEEVAVNQGETCGVCTRVALDKFLYDLDEMVFSSVVTATGYTITHVVDFEGMARCQMRFCVDVLPPLFPFGMERKDCSCGCCVWLHSVGCIVMLTEMNSSMS